MSELPLAEAGGPGPSKAPPRGIVGALRRGEDGLVSLALAAMVLLPLLEIALRPTLGIGISGSTSLVQHLTLIVGMLGGAIAAREGRLLALATGTLLPEGRWRLAARVFSGAFAALVAAYLTVAGVQFVQSEMDAGGTLAYGIPLWAVQWSCPSASDWSPSGCSGTPAAVGGGGWPRCCWRRPCSGWLPIRRLPRRAAGAGAAGPAGRHPPRRAGVRHPGRRGADPVLGRRHPHRRRAVDHYRLVTNPSLPTIPLFTLAGYFLAEGGASRPADAGVPGPVRLVARRTGDRHRPGLRLLHLVHRRFRRDHPGPGRPADAGAAAARYTEGQPWVCSPAPDRWGCSSRPACR